MTGVTVVTNKDVMKDISSNMKMPGGPGPKGAPKGKKGPNPEGMPAPGPAGDNKTPPAPMGAKAGLGDSPVAIIVSAKNDAISGATARKSKDEFVTLFLINADN